MALDAASSAHFEALRQAHYPVHLNRIAAHLTLFHALPATAEVADVLSREAAAQYPFTMRVSSVRPLGRGVAYFTESQELLALHKRLSTAFAAHLIPQDRQSFRPHIVVQNKVSGEEDRVLLGSLSATFTPWHVTAKGLVWWNYLSGPWEGRAMLPFTAPE